MEAGDQANAAASIPQSFFHQLQNHDHNQQEHNAECGFTSNDPQRPWEGGPLYCRMEPERTAESMAACNPSSQQQPRGPQRPLSGPTDSPQLCASTGSSSLPAHFAQDSTSYSPDLTGRSSLEPSLSFVSTISALSATPLNLSLTCSKAPTHCPTALESTPLILARSCPLPSTSTAKSAAVSIPSIALKEPREFEPAPSHLPPSFLHTTSPSSSLIKGVASSPPLTPSTCATAHPVPIVPSPVCLDLTKLHPRTESSGYSIASTIGASSTSSRSLISSAQTTSQSLKSLSWLQPFKRVYISNASPRSALTASTSTSEITGANRSSVSLVSVECLENTPSDSPSAQAGTFGRQFVRRARSFSLSTGDSAPHQRSTHTIFQRMVKLTRNQTMPAPTSKGSGVLKASNSNVFSFPALSLTRTTSEKSLTGGIESSPPTSGSGTRSRSASGSDSTPIAPIISAILHGNFLMLSDLYLDILIRVMTGKNSTALETISLTGAAISGADGKILAKLIRSSDAANIKILKLNRNAISQEAYKSMFEAWKFNHTITTLSLVRSGVNDKTIKYLAKALNKNDTLRELDLSSNRITAAGIEILCEALHYHRALSRLCLQSNSLKKAGAPHLARLLTKNRVIRHLNIGSNGLGAEGCVQIADAVRFNRTLNSLSLDMNEMGPRGASAIAAALVSNRHLNYLYIPHNSIEDEGLAAICESLKRNKYLISLDLELNHIGSGRSEVGMDALGQVLRTNSTLREINLSYNIFSGPAIQKLMSGVAKNSTLESLVFTNCCISTEGVMAIAEVLPKSIGLQNLGLTSNPDIGVEGYTALAVGLAKNRSMKGMQLDYNSEDRHVLYESIQNSLTRNFIWQQAIYAAACRILVLSRVVQLGRPVNQKLLLSQQQLQQQSQVQSSGAWKLLKRVKFGRTNSATSLTSLISLPRSYRVIETSGSPTILSPTPGASAQSRNGSIPGSKFDDIDAEGGAPMDRQPSTSSVNGTQIVLPHQQQQLMNQGLLLGGPQRLHQEGPHPAATEYNAHGVMAKNLGNLPYEIFETICAFLDPGRTMSIAQIRATVQAAGDRSTLVSHYTREKMLERIFHCRYIAPVGMRYSVRASDERV